MPAGLDPRESADAAAVGAAEALSGAKRVDELRLGNGVLLRIKPVPPLAMRTAALAVPQPQPPRVWIATKGTDKNDPNDRGWEANPDDPDYRIAVQQWMTDSDEAALRVALILGTEIIEVPDGIVGPDSDDWIAQIDGVFAASGVTGPPLRREPEAARYLDWLRYYAIPSDEDLFLLTRVLLTTTVVTEEALRDALAAFRNLQTRRTDRALEPAPQRDERDHLPTVDDAAGSGA